MNHANSLCQNSQHGYIPLWHVTLQVLLLTLGYIAWQWPLLTSIPLMTYLKGQGQYAPHNSTCYHDLYHGHNCCQQSMLEKELFTPCCVPVVLTPTRRWKHKWRETSVGQLWNYEKLGRLLLCRSPWKLMESSFFGKKGVTNTLIGDIKQMDSRWDEISQWHTCDLISYFPWTTDCIDTIGFIYMYQNGFLEIHNLTNIVFVLFTIHTLQGIIR